MSATTPAPKRFGCCSGCLLLIVLFVAALVAGGYGAYRYRDVLFAMSLESMRAGVKAQLEQLESEGRVPEAHRALYEDIKQRVLDPKLGILAIMGAQKPIQDTLADGKLDEVEVRLLESALAFLKEHPQATLAEFFAYSQEYAKLCQGVIKESSAKAVEDARAARIQQLAPALTTKEALPSES